MKANDLHDTFQAAANRLYGFCEYPAVRRRLCQLLDRDIPAELNEAFIRSDIVKELHDEQNADGGWGHRLLSKDYSAKHRFPTSLVALARCHYIGLTMDDRDILIRAQEYLEDYLEGRGRERFKASNERVIPWNRATLCNALEAIAPNHPLCDRTYNEWLYIISRAYEDGAYNHNREAAAQHELFATREERLVPMQFELLLKRRENVAPALEECMLRHHGSHAYTHGWFWAECPAQLPQNFIGNKTRRWFMSFNYINQFRGSALYLSETVDWLLANRNADGLWDWGLQIKDPWGYFGYFSCNRHYAHNRVVDCTMEALSFLKQYMIQND